MEDKKFEDYLKKYSEKNKQVVYSGGMSTCSTLGVVFITLKLLGYVNWSWLWVTAPFWAPFVFVMTAFIIGLVCIIPISFWEAWNTTNNKESNDGEINTESRTDTIDTFVQKESLVLNSHKSCVITPEFNPEEPEGLREELKTVVTEEKSKKKRNSKRKSKKNVESNTTTEADSNK